jgi:hypothetical protein
LFGALDYDHFLAEVSQTVAIDVAAAAGALARLIGDDALRASLGAAARQRAQEVFAWPRIIAAYEALWRDQEKERQEFARIRGHAARANFPANYPPPDRSFAAYPTHWLGADGLAKLSATAGAATEVERLLALPLTNHAADRRIADLGLLRLALARAEAHCSVADFDSFFLAAGIDQEKARATLAWMLKYDLIRVIQTF